MIKTKYKLKPVPIDSNPALVQTKAWLRVGDKPSSEPMLTRFTDAYMRHWGEMIKTRYKLKPVPIDNNLALAQTKALRE